MIPDEAVYAAAEAVYGSGLDGSPVRDAWLRDFRVALEAAGPYMLADTKADVWAEAMRYAEGEGYLIVHADTVSNPYRSKG